MRERLSADRRRLESPDLRGHDTAGKTRRLWEPEVWQCRLTLQDDGVVWEDEVCCVCVLSVVGCACCNAYKPRMARCGKFSRWVINWFTGHFTRKDMCRCQLWSLMLDFTSGSLTFGLHLKVLEWRCEILPSDSSTFIRQTLQIALSMLFCSLVAFRLNQEYCRRGSIVFCFDT